MGLLHSLPIQTLLLYNHKQSRHLIECLKLSGLEIKDIKLFFQWVAQGSSTYGCRKELFEHRKAVVEEEIKALEKSHAMLEFKCWYYETAMKDGTEDNIRAMLPDKLPAEIQKLYDKAHS